MCGRGNKIRVKSNDVNDSGSYIPPEIIKIVLSNLPSKSLVRFQCVSKSWRHMISELCAAPSQNSKKSNPSNYIICIDGLAFNCPYSWLRLENELDLGRDIILNSVRCSYLVLVLLIAQYVNGLYYILWNPSIRKWRKISFPFCAIHSYHNRYGICSTWSSKDSYISDYVCSFMAVSADGAVYWSALVQVSNRYGNYLVKFDSKDDQLHMIKMPEYVERSGTRVRLSTLRDTLYVWSIHNDKADRLMGLWVLKEDGSWMNLMNITYMLPYNPWEIWFMNDGNDILVNMCDESSLIYTCNLANKVFTRIGSHFRGLIPYVDCPVFPEIQGPNN